MKGIKYQKFFHFKYVLASFAFFIIFLLWLIPKFGSEPFCSEVYLLDLRFWYSKSDVLELFSLLGIDGINAYRVFIIYIDMIYPIAYGLFLFLLIGYLNRCNPIKKVLWDKLYFLPLLVMLFDYIENISILVMLNNYKEFSTAIVSIGSLATLLKWTTLGLTFIFLLITIFALLKSTYKKFVQTKP